MPTPHARLRTCVGYQREKRFAPAPAERGNLSAARVQRDALRAAIEQGLAQPWPGAGCDAVLDWRGGGRRTPGGTRRLRDRVGGRDALVKALNHQFMPWRKTASRRHAGAAAVAAGDAGARARDPSRRRTRCRCRCRPGRAQQRDRRCRSVECIRESATASARRRRQAAVVRRSF